MCWAVLPSRGDRRTGVASVAGGNGHCGSVLVIGGMVLGTLLRVRRQWTRFVDLSACFVVGLGAFMMGGASDIRRRSSYVVRFILTGTWLTGVRPHFVHHSGPPFVGPASVPLAGALVGHRCLAGSMRGMGL